MPTRLAVLLLLGVSGVAAGPDLGDAAAAGGAGTTVEVTAVGTVDFKDILSPPLAFVHVGETATLTFRVRADVVAADAPGSLRRYLVDDASLCSSRSRARPSGWTPGTRSRGSSCATTTRRSTTSRSRAGT